MKPKRMIIFILIGILLSVGGVFAWFEYEEIRTIFVSPGEFEATLQIYFDETLVTSGSPYYDALSQLLTVNAFDSDAPNYIGKLKVTVEITVHNASRFRFRMLDEWLLTRYFTGGNQISLVIPNELRTTGVDVNPYGVHPSFRTRDNDSHLYFDGIIGKNETLTLTLIDGGTPYPVRTTDTYYEEVHIMFQVIIDVVQANRFPQVWNIESDYFTNP